MVELKMTNPYGTELDCVVIKKGYSYTLKAKGGRVNKDYNEGFESLLRKFKEEGLQVDRVILDSSIGKNLLGDSIMDRCINDSDMPLTNFSDPTAVRKSIQRTVPQMASLAKKRRE